jgi:hypothetical protein
MCVAAIAASGLVSTGLVLSTTSFPCFARYTCRLDETSLQVAWGERERERERETRARAHTHTHTLVSFCLLSLSTSVRVSVSVTVFVFVANFFSVPRYFAFPEPPTDGRRLKDLYHNCTNSILQQLKRKFWKIANALFRISSLTNLFK